MLKETTLVSLNNPLNGLLVMYMFNQIKKVLHLLKHKITILFLLFSLRCGHCKRLAPTWEELAKTLSSEGKVKIAHVDCTLEENKDLCNDQEVGLYWQQMINS